MKLATPCLKSQWGKELANTHTSLVFTANSRTVQQSPVLAMLPGWRRVRPQWTTAGMKLGYRTQPEPHLPWQGAHTDTAFLGSMFLILDQALHRGQRLDLPQTEQQCSAICKYRLLPKTLVIVLCWKRLKAWPLQVFVTASVSGLLCINKKRH